MKALCRSASSMAALQSFGLDVVTPQPAVELGTDEYAALRDGMARRLNCEGAVVYGCNEAGVVVRMWKQRSHAYAMERAAQEAIVTHRLCGVALRSRLAGRLAGCQRRCAGASATGKRNARLPCAVCSVAACDGAANGANGPLAGCRTAPPMRSRCKTSSRSVCRRRCARAVPSDATSRR
ncbi:hypothetical protein TcBrA4_0069000 [Trypanosoma cruzi]|nr:hypothetical protein TcBrA4_0069000 [Trypanosoma cruzi]